MDCRLVFPCLRMILLFLLFHPCISLAQPAPEKETVFDMLAEHVKKPYLSLGMLTQVVADFQPDRPSGGNGFSLSAVRVSVGGSLDRGLSYFVQPDFVRDPILLDARLSARIRPGLALDMGLFKVPFSAEFLTGAASIDFVNRSQVVSTLAPKRQIGISIRTETHTGLLAVSAGVFNGNGRQVSGNDNNTLLYVGRLKVTMPYERGLFEIGTHVSYDEDGNDGHAGKQILAGGDVRWVHRRWLAAGEWLYADIQRRGMSDRQPYGYYATLGYMPVQDRHQVLVRWDAFFADSPGSENTRFIVVGYNFWMTRAYELQLNYMLPVHDASVDHHRLLINFQVAF